MYYVELIYHIRLLKYLVTLKQKTDIFQTLIHRFTMTDSYCNKVSLFCLKYFLHGHGVSFV